MARVVFAAVLALLVGLCAAAAPSNGLGDHIDWVSLEEATQLAAEQSKPILLVIHKSWCGACKALKPKFAASDRIAELSKSFLMVNAMDNDEPAGSEYSPDGGYIPRLLFLDSKGTVLTDVVNRHGSEKHKYYYYDADHIAEAMTEVAAAHASGSGADEL